ncbi:MAG: succinate dehydrogenase, cytochrome b556 subunit [Nitrosomonas sp.]|nr:succinate dehydrogenase, cytochrome b556 subunit [Nitrosomonas sp.]
MEVNLQNKRPKHLDLLKIKQPLPAVVSIFHRISGTLLFFPGIPLMLYGLQMMLNSQQSFEALLDVLSIPVIKSVLLLSLWFFLHHLCAGIRHLALDFHIGSALAQARLGSKIVLISGALLTLLIGIAIW